jgi:hypothetical protein
VQGSDEGWRSVPGARRGTGVVLFSCTSRKTCRARTTRGKTNRRWKPTDGNLPTVPLKSVGDVSGLLEETINRVRQGPFDLRAANAIGFLASVLLRSLEQGPVEDRLSKIEAALAANARAMGALVP